MDMMQTGEEFSVQWDIQAHSLIRKSRPVFESKAGKIQIIENGVAVDYSEEEATKILSEDAVTAIADVKMGDCTATAWGCDLTYDYIKINADYRS
mgnify:CR=1 FL=1